ncbi:MAG: sulfotransferase [Sphingomonadaceae bacterium]|nr:sulfotransferase [Sphingomonadaceae bacterium]
MMKDARQAIDTALSAGDIARAAGLAQSALAQGQRNAMLLNLAAWQHEERQDFAGAHALLREAQAFAPDDPLIRIAIGSVLRKEERFGEAVAVLDRAIASAPGNAAAWLERAYALDFDGLLIAAVESYRRAADLDPTLAPPLAGLASVSARQGEVETARGFAMRALAIDPDNVTALCALGRCDIEEEAYSQALTSLRAVTGRTSTPPADRVIALGLAGDALDRLGKTDDAFESYAAAKAIFAQQYASRASVSSDRQFVEGIRAAFDRIDPAAWTVSPEATSTGEASGHVFLLGYPRSGTTLVENILASAPEVEALEERPTLRAANLAFLSDADGFTRLAGLDPAAADPFRTTYWERVKASGCDVRGKVFVDMDPLKSTKLPVIAKLFPDARILLMRRDPRDVVWSCFHTNFVYSPAALEFTTLETGAQHYDAVMRLTERCLALLPLAVHVVNYRSLVTDFDATTKALCEFAGVPWSPVLRDFGKTARRRGVTTASRPQVRRGLYDGSEQWRRYAARLELVLPILRPWIEKFGFPD